MTTSRTLSTADVPPQFLKPAMLVGRIPFRASRQDQRVSYTLYIPPDHYNPDPSKRVSGLNGNNGDYTNDSSSVYQRLRIPLIVNIHGTSRPAEKCRDQLIPFATKHGVAILAPFFPANLDSPYDLDSYKLLRSKTLSSDLVLFSILKEVGAMWPGIITDKFFLLGFSGGGQFVSRFLYLYPEKLYAASVGAPGRVTSLDDVSDWPKGIRDVKKVFGDGVVVDKAKIGRLLSGKIQMVVGDDDNFLYGGEGFWKWSRKMELMMKGKGGSPVNGHEEEEEEGGQKDGVINQHNGTSDTVMAGMEVTGRIDTLKKLQNEWREAGIDARLDVVNGGVAHEAAGVLPNVLEFFEPFVVDVQKEIREREG